MRELLTSAGASRRDQRDISERELPGAEGAARGLRAFDVSLKADVERLGSVWDSGTVQPRRRTASNPEVPPCALRRRRRCCARWHAAGLPQPAARNALISIRWRCGFWVDFFREASCWLALQLSELLNRPCHLAQVERGYAKEHGPRSVAHWRATAGPFETEDAGARAAEPPECFGDALAMEV